MRPELVVEIAFNELQASRRYPGGLALRFARVVRYRPDKRPEDADTIETVRAIAAAQGAAARRNGDYGFRVKTASYLSKFKSHRRCEEGVLGGTAFAVSTRPPCGLAEEVAMDESRALYM